MRYAQKKRTALFVLSVVLGIFLTNLLIRFQQPTTTASTPTAPAVTKTPESQRAGRVAGSQTTIEAPAGVEVAVTPSTAPPAAKPAANKPAQTPRPAPTPTKPTEPAPTQPPAPDVPRTPETVIVNLKTPLTYTLRQGERSPALQHLMIDGVHYEWKPGKATYWQNDTPDPTLPLWATILHDRPETPYISDNVPFVVQAAATAKPGEYEAKIIIVIRPGVELGVPIAVKVLPAKQPAQPIAPPPAAMPPRDPTDA